MEFVAAPDGAQFRQSQRECLTSGGLQTAIKFIEIESAGLTVYDKISRKITQIFLRFLKILEFYSSTNQTNRNYERAR